MTEGCSGATAPAAHPQDSERLVARPVSKRQSWLAELAIAVVVIIFLWAVWPEGGAGGMTAEDFKQMYEGGPSVDPAFPPPTFP